MYFVDKGVIKIIAENDFPFAVYRTGNNFGHTEILLKQKRNGKAIAMLNSELYQIHRNQLEDILNKYPTTRSLLVQDAIRTSKRLFRARS